MTTSLSKKGEEIIKKFEHLMLRPYLDQANIPTIGWGTTQYENGKRVTMLDKPITESRAQTLFNFEAKAKSYVIAEAIHRYKVTLNQNQFDACVSLSYNIGSAGFLRSTAFRLIRANPNNPAIRKAFMMWVKITVKSDGVRKKIVSYGLSVRRRLEADLYFSPLV